VIAAWFRVVFLFGGAKRAISFKDLWDTQDNALDSAFCIGPVRVRKTANSKLFPCSFSCCVSY
jgi:hypothetical protein